MKRSKIYMLVGTLLLSTLFFLPLWNITLEAPQYPDPIGMNIFINKFEGAGDNDIKNINIMNHYVGMKDIPEVIPEFSIFPYVIGAMIILGLIFVFIGKRTLYLTWFILMILFGTVAMYDFYQWEYEYGHDLKENAAIKFTDENGNPMTYQPPLIGAKTILNFRAISMPRIGAYLMAAGLALSIFAFLDDKKSTKKQVLSSVLILLLSNGLYSCEVKQEPISYGSDACDFCRMTIVDKQHAAEIVTVKGKAYKYDAIECMMNDLNNWDRPPAKLQLVADYSNPGELVDAPNASFLISEKIPSPMGAYLSAFGNKSDRDKTHTSEGGEVLDWAQLKTHFSKSISHH